ncbi:MAG: adenine deaminase [Anaerolineaceae bacterium]
MSFFTFSKETQKALIDCAMGRISAELVIKGGRWVCVQTGEIIDNTSVAVIDGRIACVGEDLSHTIGPETRIIEAGGRYLVPGLLDAHMHVESGMLTVTEFVRVVVPHGTTGMFIDPHEMANVLGVKGVKVMVDEAAKMPIHVFVQVPSCVPSAPGFEHSGAEIMARDVAEVMTWPGIIGLGEMMNFPGVFDADPEVMAKLFATIDAGKVIGGHFPVEEMGRSFDGYAAGRVADDHEGTTMEGAVARARAGMKVMMRYGSAWQDVARQVKAVTEQRLDPRHFLLCTDDSHSQTLVSEGHMDRVVRHAIQEGLDPMAAIQMATINTADHFKVSDDLGMIAPGRFADLLLVKDLKHFSADVVIARGVVAAEDGCLTIELPGMEYPDFAVKSMHLKAELKAEDFRISSPGRKKVTANVIGIVENQAPTRHLRLDVPVQNGEINADLQGDIAKLSLIERHHANGGMQVVLVQGFGLNRPCAIATSVAHDCHNLLVLGTDDACMAMAANTLAANGGGQVVILDGNIIGMVELPIAGLMANQPATIVAEKTASVLQGFKDSGCQINNPNMTLSLLALAVIPALRITDKGLLDVENFQFIPLLEKIHP